MKEQAIITVKHCHYHPQQEFQIPVSYSPNRSRQEDQGINLLETSDQQDNIMNKFQKYNPNLKRYVTCKDNILLKTTKVESKQTKKVKKEINLPNSQTNKTKQQLIKNEQSKRQTFKFKHFGYVDRPGCSCKKLQFQKFVYKPIFTSKYGLTIPQYKLDQNNQYIRPQPKEQQIKQKVPQSPIKIDANTQTIKQKPKPAVSFGDISEVKPPNIKQPITGIIPKQLDDSNVKPNLIPYPSPTLVEQNYQNRYKKQDHINNNNHKLRYKTRYAQPSVFKLVHDGKINNIAHSDLQKIVDPCQCQCHSKIGSCGQSKKAQLLNKATNDKYFAHQLISNKRSSACSCINSCSSCSCALKPFQLPQYRLNPASYGPLPVNQMNEIPYAGKVRRYDFNGC